LEEFAVEFSIKAAPPEKLKNDCVAVPVFASGKLSPAAQELDRAAKGQLSRILKQCDFDPKPGSTLMLYGVTGVAAVRVLLVGFGKQQEVGAKEYRDGVRGAVRALADAGVGEAALYAIEVSVTERDAGWATMHAATVALETTYRFDRLKSKSKDDKKGLQRLILGISGKQARGLDAALVRGIAIGEGVNFARDLGNLPPNICTPAYLAAQARALGRSHKLKV